MSGSIKALRLQNMLLGNQLTSGQLTTELGVAAKLGAFRALMAQQTTAQLLLASPTAKPIILGSATACGELGTSAVGRAIVADRTALAGVVTSANAMTAIVANASARDSLMASPAALRVCGGKDDSTSIAAGQLAPYYSWKARGANMPTAFSSQPFQIVYGNGILVAISPTTFTAVSYDGGITWSNTLGSVGTTMTGVAFGNGIFVAVNSSGSIWWSVNGTAWNALGAISSSFYCLIYAGGKFVALGGNGSSYYSTTGLTWTLCASAPTNTTFGLAHNGTLFTACTSVSTAQSVWSSTDGSTWTQRTHALTGPTNQTRTIGSAGPTFMLANNTDNQVATSPDGINWTNRTLTFAPYVVGGGAGLCVALGSTGQVATSPDLGVTWTNRPSLVNAVSISSTYRMGLVDGQINIPGGSSTLGYKMITNF